MKWTPGNRENVEDVRGRSGGGAVRMGGLGIGGLLLVLILSWATGVDFLSLVGPEGGGVMPPTAGTSGGEVRTTPEEEKMVDFVDAVMQRRAGDVAVEARGPLSGHEGGDLPRRDPSRAADPPSRRPGRSIARRISWSISISDSSTSCARGSARRATSRRPTSSRTRSVTTSSTCSGSTAQVRRRQQAMPHQQNELSVRLELQADCFAGVWGRHAAQEGRAARGQVELEPGDLEEGLNAAASIGDDRIQRMSGARVAPDRFTHGSSEQRVAWFRRGFDSGDMDACETFQ